MPIGNRLRRLRKAMLTRGCDAPRTRLLPAPEPNGTLAQAHPS